MDCLTVNELFRLTPWRRPAIDLAIYGDLEWEHPQSGRRYRLAATHVALEGVPMRLLVRPPDSEEYAIIKIKGLFRRKLVTEAAAPSKTEINAELARARDLGVVQGGLEVP